MPDIWAHLTRHPDSLRWVASGVGAFALLVTAGFILWRVYRRQIPPDELERRRREAIHQGGKIGDGEIIDVDGTTIVYSYSVGGVEYTVAQDAAAIESLLPIDRMRIVGSASVRYDPKNPPNSIVLCEAWSGLRLHSVSSQSQ
jgi:hypothetical protein